MSGKQKGCQSREVFSRMNYLYQASALMTEVNPKLACYYGNLCKSIGKKAVLRMEPTIKRTLCKRCGIVLKPGITAKLDSNEYRSNAKISGKILVCCNVCSYSRNFVLNSDYDLWLDNPKSVVETYNTENTTT